MGQYVTLGPVEMYYESGGDGGDPILFLHGGGGGAMVWQAHMDHFSRAHRVFAPEMRGRARTADVEGPISYDLMAGDTLAFIDAVIGEPVHLVGGSDGGDIGLVIATHRPEVLHSMVVIGANYHYSVTPPEVLEMSADDEAMAMGRRVYEEFSPDGIEHFPVVWEKLKAMWRTEPALTAADLGRIEVPTLVISGDRDEMVPLEHTMSMFQALPNSQLAVFPRAHHAFFIAQPDPVNRLIEDFIEQVA